MHGRAVGITLLLTIGILASSMSLNAASTQGRSTGSGFSGPARRRSLASRA
jgi:hypothetical protein